MRFVYSNPDLEGQIAEARTLDALEAALQGVSRLIPSFLDKEIYGRQVFCKGLDALVPRLLGKLRLPTVTLERSNEHVCILATRFYDTGGHSKVAADISARLGAERVTIIFTDLYRQLQYRQTINEDRDASPFHRRALVLLTAPTMVEKILELHALLSAMRPGRILLMCNHMDMVAVTGAWAFRSVTEFIHHADHLPALGATLPFFSHVDLNYPVHLACTEAGLNPTYAAMTAATLERPPRRADGVLRIATCGSLVKYRQPGRYRWVDYALAALRVPDTELVHIGPVDDAFRQEVAAALSAAGVEPSRYVYAGTVPNLPAELVAREVDVFLGSYPTSGGRANLEAMATAIPTIVAHDIDAPPLIPDRWPLPQFTTISSPEELPELLARVDELTARASDPAAMETLRAQLRRFEDYVDGRPLGPIAVEETLPD